MVRLGMGYAWVPRHLVQEELAEGSLVQLGSHRRQQRYLYTYLLTPRWRRWGRRPSCCCAACASNTRGDNPR